MCFPGSPKSDKVLPGAGSPYPVSNSAPSQAARETRRESSSMLAGGASATIWDDSGPVSRARESLAISTRVPPMYIGGRTLSDLWRNAKTGFFHFRRGALWGLKGGSRARKLPTKNTLGTLKSILGCYQKPNKPRQIPAGGVTTAIERGLFPVSRSVRGILSPWGEVRMYIRGRTLSDFWQNAKTGFFRFWQFPDQNAKRSATGTLSL